MQTRTMTRVWLLAFGLLFVAGSLTAAPLAPPGGQTPKEFTATASSESEKLFFGDRHGRYFLDLTGWKLTPPAATPDGKGLYTWHSAGGGELTLVVTSDLTVTGNPLTDPADRAATLRDLLAGLQWTDTKILKQQVIKAGEYTALDVVIVGSKKLRYKGRFVFVQQGDAVHQMAFTTLSSEYDWLRQSMNQVIESFRAGKPPMASLQ
ncbi:MAG: hypothetical protein K1Y36_22555 [Blastocatellia bacterium]|nr:hypothetical protein [Blastocatellia bacterium]